MKIKDAIIKLEKSKAFIEWKQQNPTGFLASLFTMFEGEKTEEWLANFHVNQSITTFHVDESGCERKGEEKTEGEIKKLDIDQVKVEVDDAIRNVVGMLTIKTGESTTKTIAILQNLEEGQVWNISLMTSSMNLYNVRLDAGTGNKLSESYGKLFNTL